MSHEKTQRRILQLHPLRGVDRRWRTDPATATMVRDMTWDDRDAWKVAGGFRELTADYDVEGVPTNAYDGEDAITSITWFQQRTGAMQWLVYETAGGRLSYFNGSLAPTGNYRDVYYLDGDLFNGSIRTRTYFQNPRPRTQYATFGDNLYIVNGVDEPLVFDGLKADRAGFTIGPGAPDARIADKSAGGGSNDHFVTASGYGLGTEGKKAGYRYRMSLVNERGQESPLSPPSDLVEFTTDTGAGGVFNHAVVTLQLETGPDTTVARRLYRTLDIMDADGEPSGVTDGEIYYFCAEIPDNETTFYMDIIPDAALGSAVDEEDLGPWPGGAYLLAVFKSTMFLVDGDGRLRFSAPNQPEVYPLGNVFDLGDHVAGPIKALHPTKNALVVFKERGIYLVKGDPSSGFNAQTLTRDIGCSAPDSVAELPGLGVVFLSSEGVFLLKGALENTGTDTGYVRLSAPITDLIKNINLSAIEVACSCINHRDKEFWLAVPTFGVTVCDLLLVYHYDIGAWSYREDYPIGCLTVTKDHRGYVVFGSHDTSTPGLFVYGQGWSDKAGTAIAPRREGAHIDFGSYSQAAIPRRVSVFTLGHGTNDVQVNWIVNRNPDMDIDIYTEQDGNAYRQADQLYPTDLTRKARDADVLLFPTYGDVNWATVAGTVYGRWSEARPIVQRFEINPSHLDPIIEMQPIVTFAGRKGQIIGIDIEVEVTDDTILPFSPLSGAGRP